MAKPVKKVLFLNLAAFSVTGGIEKFNRAFLRALSELEKEGMIITNCLSAFDTNVDTNYFEAKNYKCYKANKMRFVFAACKAASKYDTIILGHINLALVGWIIKNIFPSKQIVLITHGIEVWQKLKSFKNYMINHADRILAVSNFTKNTVAKVHKVNPDKITVFHNTIDPFFNFPSAFKKPEYLLKRYGLQPTDPVIFSLARLSHSEKYKGCDRVIKVLSLLKHNFPSVKYILAGKSDEAEKARLNTLVKANKVENDLLMTGFVKNEEVTDHYMLADVFILPSCKEGFGIVFIEAMACGLSVIAGSKDGSADALRNGELGLLVDPADETEIFDALKKCLDERHDWDENSKKLLQQKVVSIFGFQTFKQNLQKVLA